MVAKVAHSRLLPAVDGVIDYVDHVTEVCGAVKITYADAVITMSKVILALEVALIMKRLMYQRWKGFHLVRHAQFQPHIPVSLVVQNQTVPRRILVITLITADFQFCHYKMSKKSGSSHVSEVFFVYLCTFLFFCCVLGRVQGISHTFRIMY